MGTTEGVRDNVLGGTGTWVDGHVVAIGKVRMATAERSGGVDDRLDVPLEDAELLAEVELTTNLIIAASESEATLSQEQVDRLLGLVEAAGATGTQGVGQQIPVQHRRPD